MTSEALKDVAAGLHVIDVDCHWNEPPDLWTSRAPAKFKDRVPHVETVDGRSEWFVEGDKSFGGAVVSVIGEHEEKHNWMLGTVDQLSKANWDAKARVDYMDKHGIWAEIVYPNAAGFSAAKFMTTFKDPELELECIRIYNDAGAEWQKESGNRLFPMGLLPARHVDEMVKEMRRCVEELGLIGFAISDNLGAMGLPDYTHPYWEPFWEAANSLAVPLNFHTGGTLLDAARAPWKMFTPLEIIAMNTTAANGTNASIMANLLMSGLHDQYPNVKFCSVESGIGWVPYMLETLEHTLDEIVPDQKRKLQRRPKEYFRDHWYACFWFEAHALGPQLENIGVHNVMFETDFPHPTCLYPENQEHLNRTLRALDDYSRRRILQDNALELYKLPMPEGMIAPAAAATS